MSSINERNYFIKAIDKLGLNEFGNVLDIGSLNINGSMRDVLFPNYDHYFGIDMVDGEGVDKVINAHDIVNAFQGERYNTIVCCNTLEHDNKFWLSLEVINRFLNHHGLLMFCVPTIDFPIHNHPNDYWRMTESAVREVIFEGFEILDLQTIPTKEVEGQAVNYCICAIGRKL